MRLTRAQRLELVAGPDSSRSAFQSDTARRLAYFEHQHELHQGLAPGRRPWAFWAYIIGDEPPLDDEPRALAERGLLLPEEEAAIMSAHETDGALAAAAQSIRSRRGRQSR